MTEQQYGRKFAAVPFERRVLILPQCLRPSRGCPGEMTRQGVDCGECRRADCVAGQLRLVAVEAGYHGVCIAPGGKLALRYLLEQQPEGVIAVACQKELTEGLETVGGIDWQTGKLATFIVPLLQDGCVDTVVDVEAARAAILASEPE